MRSDPRPGQPDRNQEDEQPKRKIGDEAVGFVTDLAFTDDEGGGYYDSGFIQPVDFFGTGPRIPMIALSPFSTGGHITHSYTEHSSFVKFVERNWGLGKLSARSRDNLPNPKMDDDNPYVPTNMTAIGICSICSSSAIATTTTAGTITAKDKSVHKRLVVPEPNATARYISASARTRGRRCVQVLTARRDL